jgi:adenylyltransferase/sulfurtransferase
MIDDYTRYKRQIIISEIGEEGQKKLGEAKVFVAGLGGLGSVSAYYLTAAGVGYLKMVDRDTVEMTNLNRQILHRTEDIGMSKAESAMKKLKALNPSVQIETYRDEIRDDNIEGLVGDCSIIIDAMDNLNTRRILNRYSLKKGMPFIYGGVERFSGMITTFVPGETPCFECIFSGVKEIEEVKGIIGPVPGVIGSLQTIEAIKIILGLDGLLKGRLLFFTGLDMSFKEIKIEKNPHCVVCLGRQ